MHIHGQQKKPVNCSQYSCLLVACHDDEDDEEVDGGDEVDDDEVLVLVVEEGGFQDANEAPFELEPTQDFHARRC